MTEQVTFLPVYSLSNFTYTMSLQGQHYQFNFYLNPISNKYYMDIADVNGNSIASGVCLVVGSPLLSSIDMSAFGLTGYFIVVRDNANNTDYSNAPYSFGNNFALLYIYTIT